jgi:aminotransferase
MTTRRIASRIESLDQPGWRSTEAQMRQLAAEGVDVLTLYGMPIRALPQHVIAAAEDEARRLPVPPPSRGLLELREAIAEKLSREADVDFDAEREILITNGAMQAVNVVCRTLLDPGDEVLMPSPTFFFYGIVELAGGTPVYVPSSENDEWSWNIERLEAAITSRTKLILLCSPVNPTGFVASKEMLTSVFDVAARHDLLVLSDESYDRMVYEDRYVTAARVRQHRDRTILIRSITKSYAMASWRIGYIVSPPELTDAFAKVLEWEVLYGNSICQRAAAAAISGPQEWLQDIASEFKSYRDEIWPEVNAVEGLSVVRPKATPYMFVNVSDLGATGDDFASLLTLRYGVPVTSGRHFVSKDHVRVGFGALEDRTRAELCRRVRLAADEFRT